jgi:hypothetical protein
LLFVVASQFTMTFDQHSYSKDFSENSSFASGSYYYASNRSRTNTGDSSSGGSYTNSETSGSRSSGRENNHKLLTTVGVNELLVGTATATDPPPGRRRSHRPRGCRGGRKNRKSQQAKATALIPKEILDDSPVPLSPRVDNLPFRKANNTTHKQAITSLFTKNMHDISTNTWTQQQDQQPMIWSRTEENNCTGGLPFMSHHSSGSTAAFNLTRANTSNTQHFSTDFNNDREKHHLPESHQHLFRPLQPKEETNAVAPFPYTGNKQLGLSFASNNMQTSKMQGGNPASTFAQYRPSSLTCDILPPLPAVVPLREPSPPFPGLAGPNPYAMSLSSGSGIHQIQQQSSNDTAIQVKPRQRVQIAQNQQTSNSRMTNALQHLDTTIANKPQQPASGPILHSAAANEDYRNQRLHKQRQMLGNGGSLFVTSPRSFLFGRPESCAPAATVW